MRYTVYIGTYTYADSVGVYSAALDDDGKLTLIGSAEVASPSYLIYSSDKKYIYASNEARDVDGVPGGAITAFEITGDGALKKIVTRPTGGGSPCHVLEHMGYLYASNYGSGSVTAFPIVNGVPGKAELTHQHEGDGPNKRRQEGPHAHCAMAVPGTDTFCVVDLGIDQARFYRKDGAALKLIQAISFPGGAGPRHVVFSKDGLFGWIVTELSNEVFSIRFDNEWAITGAMSTLPAGYDSDSACAAIRLSNDGKLIAASNRGHDSAAIFDVDVTTGLLTLNGIYSVGGENPRDINFSPDDRWLLSANQDTDTVTVLSVKDGFNIVNGAAITISKPTSILV